MLEIFAGDCNKVRPGCSIAQSIQTRIVMKRRAMLKVFALLPALPLLGQARVSLAASIAGATAVVALDVPRSS